MADVGKKIKACRKAAGMTLKEMSALVGISVSFISDIENGRSNPSLERLESIADKLGTTVSWLMGEGASIKEGSVKYQTGETELQKLLSSSDFRVVLDCLKDFPEWEKKDRDELIGYLKAKKLLMGGKKQARP